MLCYVILSRDLLSYFDIFSVVGFLHLAATSGVNWAWGTTTMLSNQAESRFQFHLDDNDGNHEKDNCGNDDNGF